MKFILISLQLFCILTISACNAASFKNISGAKPASVDSRTLTVLTYNIRIGAGRKEYGKSPYAIIKERTTVLDLKPIINAIKSLDPDIIALQEVYEIHQAKEIGEALGLNYSYTPHGVDDYGKWWGVATLSKFPINQVKRQEISYGYSNTRANLISEIRVYDKDIIVTNIHKDKDLKDGSSLRKTVSSIISNTKPTILIGDLNIKPTYKRYSILTNNLLDTATALNTKEALIVKKTGTFLGKNPKKSGKRIDYIFVDKKNFKVVEVGLLDEKHWPASDHLGYFAKLKLLK